MLCFFTNFASTQSIEAPVSGKDLSVDKVLLFVFTLKFINGVGDPGTSAYDIGNDTKFLPFVDVLTDAVFAENLNFCLFLLLTQQYGQLQFASWIILVVGVEVVVDVDAVEDDVVEDDVVVDAVLFVEPTFMCLTIPEGRL